MDASVVTGFVVLDYIKERVYQLRGEPIYYSEHPECKPLRCFPRHPTIDLFVTDNDDARLNRPMSLADGDQVAILVAAVWRTAYPHGPRPHADYHPIIAFEVYDGNVFVWTLHGMMTVQHGFVSALNELHERFQFRYTGAPTNAIVRLELANPKCLEYLDGYLADIFRCLDKDAKSCRDRL